MNISPTLTPTNTNSLILNTASNLKSTCAISSTKTDENISETLKEDGEPDDSSSTSPLGPANKRQRLVE